MEGKEEIVISGISGRFPESDNVEEFWENLINGVDMVTTDERRWPIGFLGIPKRKGTLKTDLTKFDANFFGIFPNQAERVDPQIRQLLEVTYEAILDAGVNPTDIRGDNVGVYIGASAHDTFEACRKHPDIASGYDITGSACCMLANRLSYAFDFKGPSFCIDTFCSSSMMALHQAMAAIRAGECESAIVSGVNLLMNPMTSVQILAVGALSRDGKCKVFDASGDGFVRSEAIVSLFIQKKRVARRSYGTLIHSKTNTDGYKVKGVSYPSGAVQQKLLEATYKEAGVNPLDVFYFEPHGTGTEAGDPQEVNAVTEVFTVGRSTEKPLLIGATKSNMGHAEPAAALCAVTKVALALKYGVIPHNLHFNTPNPNIPALSDGRIQVVDKNMPVTGNLVGVNSTGLGGSNIHVIIAANEKSGFQMEIPKSPVLVPFSGRTEEAVKHGLSKVTNMSRNFEFETLLQKIAEVTTPGHNFRGYAILTEGETAEFEVQEVPLELPPLWFIFSGMGTLWRGMTNDLMEIQIFSDSIKKSHEILEPLGMDLMNILFYGDDDLLDRNMGTCFVAMGVALVDLLTAIGLRPDGFIGHSAGEMMCGYIDGVISQREALVCYFFKDECVLKCNGGGMAAVGLTWEEATARCPEGVYPACHNAAKNVTVSGPADKITQFVAELKTENIFARQVSTGGVAYHSPYLAPILPTFEAHIRGIILNRKPRSSKWKSSSRLEEDWTKPMKNSEYVVNNMRSPVLFHRTIQHIPPDAVVLEVAAHTIFVSVLKKSLPPTCNVFGLIRKGKGNNMKQFLTAIGKLYEFGFNVNLSPLYPKVEFPVSLETPMISPLVKWDHSKTHSLPDYLFNSSGAGETTVEVSLSKETDSYLAGHNIDGRVLYPATGYLVLVWKKFASLLGKPYIELPVVFENIRFERATILPKESSIKFSVSINSKTGEFQVSEGDSVAVTGKVGVAEPSTLSQNVAEVEKSSKFLPLSSEDIYKELRLQGYTYEGVFKGIKMADNEGRWAKIGWEENWVGFLDTMLQFPVVCKETRGLYLPTRLGKLVINPKQFFDMLGNNKTMYTEGVPVTYNQKFERLECTGIEITGLKTSIAPRKIQLQTPVLEIANFTPYFVEEIWEVEKTIKYFVDLVIENISTFSFTMREDVKTLNENISAFAMTCVQSQPLRNVESTIVSEDADADIKTKLETLGINVTSKAVEEAVHFLVTENYDSLLTLVPSVKANGFILVKSTNQLIMKEKFEKVYLISTRKTENLFFYLFRKESNEVKMDPLVINVDDKTFKWILPLQDSMAKSSANKDFQRIFITSYKNPHSGIIGLANCLRQEPGGNKVRCLFSPNQNLDLTNTNNETVQTILRGDLAMNIFNSQGILGSYRHFTLKEEELTNHATPYAYINVENRGDLSSLKFVEAPAFSNEVQTQENSNEICEVYYAPLNFRDVMLATGKLPPEALPGKLASQECILGLEFVGKDKNGKRVMGMVESKGLATHVIADPLFMWEVPQKWTMEEASTVPVAYSTAYYSLIVRGRMRNGERVLIHSGSGGVGQAAIAIALSMNCQVFTTVGSSEKKEFLKKQFPQLKEENFANSRDTSFEQHVFLHTDGQGVDLVLNSLSEEKLQASVRCLAEGGRFLEIGKYDLSRNNSLGMAIFLKNVTFHGILLDALFEKSPEDKREVVALVSEGILNGTVRPLPLTLFTTEEIEDAFRFMATGKHMGKVVLKIKDEKSMNQNPVIVFASLRTFFSSAKTFIIVGGLGGIGMELANWMVSRGVRKLVLVSRSPVKNGYQALAIRRWTRQGVQVVVVHTDVTTVAGSTKLIQDSQKIGQIGGIFNLAMVLKDNLIENQSVESFEIVTKPKIDGTLCLDVASRKLCPDVEYFVVFSSASAGRGNTGQTNYGMANSFMERVCEERKRDNLSGLAIQFGAIGDVGVIQEHMGGNDVILGGTVPQRLSSCLRVMDIFLRKKEVNVVASTVLPEISGKKSGGEKLSLLSAVAKILGLKSTASITNKGITLGELGIDSLMAVELKQILEWYADLTLSTPEIRELSWEKLEELDATKK